MEPDTFLTPALSFLFQVEKLKGGQKEDRKEDWKEGREGGRKGGKID